MKFSSFFHLSKSQALLDFVDIDTDQDTPVFVDPYAIETQTSHIAGECNDILREFFLELLDAIKVGNSARIDHLISNFHEPTDTFLGVSAGSPKGRGVGTRQSADIVQALTNSKAATSGLLEDLADTALFIPHIGRDKISDLTTNLIRRPLIEYTKQQCELHGISDLGTVPAAAPLWKRHTLSWVSDYVDLPIVDGKPVLLIPKMFVRRDISLQGRDFYMKTITDFLQAEHTRPGDSLVRVLTSKKRAGQLAVFKKDVRKKYQYSPKLLEDLASEHPHLLREYKQSQRRQLRLGIPSITDDKADPVRANELIAALSAIPKGNASATAYHNEMIGILTFLFHPGLTNPRKELEVNSGRKRIDIRFDNSGVGLFFGKMLDWGKTSAGYVPVECKNYSYDLKNPEIDQLVGRFSDATGRFGILVCRDTDNPERLLERLRDVVKAGNGYPFVLTDEDIFAMLDHVIELRRNAIQGYLEQKFNQIVS